MAVGTACCVQPTAPRSDTRRVRGDAIVAKRREQDKARGAGNGGDDELVQVVEYRSREELAELSGVAGVGAAERAHTPLRLS